MAAVDVEAMFARLDPAERERLMSDAFKAEAEAAFTKADVSATGDLSNPEEMASAVKFALPEERVRAMNLEGDNMKTMMMEFDENKNGKIEKDEFVNFIRFCIASEINDYFATAGNTAKAAAAAIKKPELQELKSLGAPAAEIVTVMSCVLQLTGAADKTCDWKTCQKAMGDTKAFLDSMNAAIEVKPETKEKVTKELGELTEEIVKKKSRAAGCMVKWVLHYIS
jgi:hypothetical protein